MNVFNGVERFFGWLLHASWQASVIAAIILLVQLLLRHRLSRAWRYGLWFLLLARLVLPVAPRSAVSIFNLTRWSHSRITPAPRPAAPASAPRAQPYVSLPLPWPDPIQAQAAPAQQNPKRPAPLPALVRPLPAATTTVTRPRPPRRVDWMALAASVWCIGMLLLAVRFFFSNRRFRRRLNRCAPVSRDLAGQIFKECAASMDVTRLPLILETDLVQSPAVYGLWRKRLLLPDGLCEELSPAELRHVLLHELAHVKRRDPELNWLIALLQIVHWFNPVLWFAFARMRADRELATDELALSHTLRRERRDYGETILKVLDRLTQPRALPGLVGIGEGKRQMKERIRAIARGGGGPRWRWAAGAVAMFIAGITLTNARNSESQGINLLKRYPTTLTKGDPNPDQARPWQFGAEDIFRVSHFTFKVDKRLSIEAGVSDLGIGHCADGAVWAVVLPRMHGTLTSSVASHPEAIANIWLRFHPARINNIFPPKTVTGVGTVDKEDQIRAIANAKFRSSWHAGNMAMIPEPKDMTVDVDTKAGPRRFFIVDTKDQTAQYVAAFTDRPAKSTTPAPYEPEVDTNRARVVSVLPPNNARDVGLSQELQIRFNRPMNPYHLKLEWLSGGFQLDGGIRVSPDRKQFTIPVRLTPGQEQKIALNRDAQREMWWKSGEQPWMKPKGAPKDGFLDADLVPANEFRWRFWTQAAPQKPGAGKPHVVSVSPPSGATTPVLTLVQITFDQPMRPPTQTFPYLQTRPFSREPSLIPTFDYDPATHQFTFPALLRPDDDTRLTLRGFFGADGAPCDPVVLHYQSAAESLDRKYVQRAKAAAQDPKLQNLLSSMKAARSRLKSGVETVQTIRLNLSKTSFNQMDAQTATFKWQGTKQCYADISGIMSMKAFILGSDGQECWLFSINDKGEKRLDRTPAAVTETDVTLMDPFNLTRRSVQEALAGANMVYAGKAKLEGRTCYRIEKWDVNQDPMAFANLTRWWIDAETLLPAEIVQSYPNGCQIVRFDYRELNRPLPTNAFQPPATAASGAKPLFFKSKPAPGEQRFLRISDGSNGRMSGRLGWHGPRGTTSSGLN